MAFSRLFKVVIRLRRWGRQKAATSPSTLLSPRDFAADQGLCTHVLAGRGWLGLAASSPSRPLWMPSRCRQRIAPLRVLFIAPGCPPPRVAASNASRWPVGAMALTWSKGCKGHGAKRASTTANFNGSKQVKNLLMPLPRCHAPPSRPQCGSNAPRKGRTGRAPGFPASPAAAVRANLAVVNTSREQKARKGDEGGLTQKAAAITTSDNPSHIIPSKHAAKSGLNLHFGGRIICNV